jgi:hypothetical protein
LPRHRRIAFSCRPWARRANAALITVNFVCHLRPAGAHLDLKGTLEAFDSAGFSIVCLVFCTIPSYIQREARKCMNDASGKISQRFM